MNTVKTNVVNIITISVGVINKWIIPNHDHFITYMTLIWNFIHQTCNDQHATILCKMIINSI